LEPLLSLLQGGSVRAQKHAMQTLFHVAQCVQTKSALASQAAAVAPCIQALQQSSDAEVREQAAVVLTCVADGGWRADIILGGGLAPLVELLKCDAASARAKAARAIASLATDPRSHAGLQAALARLVELAGVSGEAQEPSQLTLRRLSAGHNSEVRAALAQSDEATMLLCQQLLTGSEEDQQAAVLSLLNLIDRPEALATLVQGGGVPPLVALATVPDPPPRADGRIDRTERKKKEDVLQLLASVATATHADAIARQGATEVLLEAVQYRLSSRALVEAAAASLARLVITPTGRTAVLNGGDVTAVVELLNSRYGDVPQHALEMMRSLTEQSDGRVAVSASGGIAPIVRVSMGKEPLSKRLASNILCDLAKETEALPLLVRDGAVTPLVAQLREGGAAEQEPAVEALAQLVAVERGAFLATSEGILAPLVNLLLDSGVRAQGLAMQALHHLALLAETKSAVASEPNVVCACVERLQRSSDMVIREQSAAVLACMSDEGRRADIVLVGGVEALVELLRSGDGSAQAQAARAICSVADDPSSHTAASLGVAAIIDVARGDGIARTDATATLHKLAGGTNARALASIAQSDAAIRILLRHLSGSRTEQLIAVRSLRQLSTQQPALRTIVEGNGVPSIVALANSYEPGDVQREDFCLILSRLAVPPHTEAVASSGAVEILVDALMCGGPELVRTATTALARLVWAPTGFEAILQDGVAACVGVLHRTDLGVQAQALEILHCLASAGEDGRAAIGKANGAAQLVALATRPDGDPTGKMTATRILCELAKELTVLPSLIKANAAVPLVVAVRDGSADLQEAAVAALRLLTGGERDLAATKLQAISRGGRHRAWTNALTLASVDNAAEQAVTAGVVAPLVRMLQYHEGPVARAHAMHALHNLARAGTARQAIASDPEIIRACVGVIKRSTDPVAEDLHTPHGSPVKSPKAKSPHSMGSMGRSVRGARQAYAQGVTEEGVEELRELRRRLWTQPTSLAEEAAGTLRCVSDAGRRGDVIAEGGVEALVDLFLKDGKPQVQAQALRAMNSLADDPKSHPALTSALSVLVYLAGSTSDGDSREASEYATSTLHKLASGGDESVQRELASSPAATLLFVRQLDGSREEQQTAVSSLRHLADRPEALRAIVEGGGVAALIAVANRSGTAASATRDAAMLLACLAMPPHTAAVASARGTEVLIEALQTTGTPLTLVAVSALGQLVKEPQGRAAVIRAGVAPCVGLLESRSDEVQLHALLVLQAIASDGLAQAKLTEANAAAPLAALLESETSSAVQMGALHLMSCIAVDARSCRQIVENGGVAASLPLLFAKGDAAAEDVLVVLGAVATHVNKVDALGDASSPSVMGTIARFCRGSNERTREDATMVLALLASDARNAANLLITGGAQGLAHVARHLDGTAASRATAVAALEAIAPSIFGTFHVSMLGSPLLRMPLFWTEAVTSFLGSQMAQVYKQLGAIADNFYFELFHLCAQIALRRADAEEHQAVRAMKEVFEALENETTIAKWLAGIFPSIVARVRKDIDCFAAFEIIDLPDIGHLGLEVTNRVRGMALAEKALRALYQRYLREELPSRWKQLFKEATRTAYNLKYMFRESLPKTKAKFVEHLGFNLEGKSKELFTHLVRGAFEMYHGLVDQRKLAETDFLDNPQALIQVVREGAQGADERVQLLAEIAARYMQSYVDQVPPQLPLTPHHTQICAMLIFSQFFEQKERWAREYGMRAAILQMKTGEGKSIVIAMMAVYTVKQLKKKVHVLENNEGLLERDFANYKSFYESFGLTCNKTIDSTSDICYCLKKQNNTFFNQHLLSGDLDLTGTILIVDEVDDLVVNEKPTLLYQAKDDSLTPHYKACYNALIKGQDRPAKVDSPIWNDAKRIKREADAKVQGVHFQLGEQGWIMLEEGPDGSARVPKVPLSDDWLVFKNYEDFSMEPAKNTFRSCLCTPFMYQKCG
jgi:hypothetical protein